VFCLEYGGGGSSAVIRFSQKTSIRDRIGSMAQAQTTHATTEAHGGAHEDVGFPPLKTETFAGQLVWLAITFVLLYVLLSRMVLPRLGGILENRRSTIATDLDDAAAMKQRAEEAGAAYERALAEARSRAQVLAQETRSTLAAESDARRKVLEADLGKRLMEA
jgi:F-type H+-transporting ATPase subunit b